MEDEQKLSNIARKDGMITQRIESNDHKPDMGAQEMQQDFRNLKDENKRILYNQEKHNKVKFTSVSKLDLVTKSSSTTLCARDERRIRRIFESNTF